MTMEYEQPTVTVISFVAMAQLANGDDDRTRGGFDAGTDLESSIFG